MTENEKDIIVKYVNAYNNFDVAGMTENLASRVVFQNISDGETNMKIEGIEAFKNQAEAALQYFEQRQQKIESWTSTESSITIHIRYKAIAAIDFPNGLKKGDSLEMEGQSTFEFHDQKIISITDKS